MFREDSKRFSRELGKKTIQTEKPSDIGEVKKFWQNILEQEVRYNEDAQWIKDQEEELQQINQMEWKDLIVEELRVNMTEQPNGNHLDLTDSPTSGSNSSRASTNPWQKHAQKTSRAQSKLQTG